MDREKLPVLIIDKKSSVGSSLAKRLLEYFLVVLLSGRELEISKQLVHLPYRKKIPLIPDHTYSHMILFYNGESELLEILPSLVKKAQETNSKVIFITSIFYAHPKLIKYLSKHELRDVQLLVYGELFSDVGEGPSELSYYVKQAQTTGRLLLPKDGLRLIYPVQESDVIEAIIAIAFSPDRRTKPQLLMPKGGITLISIARQLQKNEPLLKVDFHKQKGDFEPFFIPDGEYVFSKYSIEEKLKSVDLSKKYVREAAEKKKLQTPKRKRQVRVMPFFTILLIALVVVPILTLAVLAVTGASAMKMAFHEALVAKFAPATAYAKLADASFSTAAAVTDSFFLFDLFAPGQKELISNQLAAGQQAAKTELDMLTALNKLEIIYNGKSSDPKHDFLQSLATIKNSLLVLQKMKAEDKLPKSVETKLSDLNSVIATFENTSEVLPTLMGFEGKRTYLVLFQNNMELRPGGGFIGSYGMLQVENGRIGKFQVQDIYDADGKLAAHVDPPYALRRYLGVQHLFMRDSNMDPDFTRDAVEATRMLKLETGESVDGVLAIDTDLLRNMISVFGSVYVPDYKETVTADNFYLLTQTHAEKDFFPGSTQKKDFLRALSNAMLAQLATKKHVSFDAFIKAIGKSLDEKHVLMAFPDPFLQKTFTVNNLSASLWDGRRPEYNVFNDNFGLVDANIGVNKANYYVKRTIQQKSAIDTDGTLLTTATVTYVNTSTKGSPFGGDYKNYVRFIMPVDAYLQSISIDDQQQPIVPAVTDPAVFTQPGFIPPVGLEVEKTEESGKSLVGFLIIVPAGSSKKVAITYTVQNAVDTSRPAFSYSQHIYKQPGTDADPYELSLSYPVTFNVLNTTNGTTDVGGKLTVDMILNKDQDFRADFAQK